MVNLILGRGSYSSPTGDSRIGAMENDDGGGKTTIRREKSQVSEAFNVMSCWKVLTSLPGVCERSLLFSMVHLFFNDFCLSKIDVRKF